MGTMTERTSFRSDVGLGALDDREVAVLTELARETSAWIAFQGLRRRLDLHQESLTRTLRRLERNGLVARDPRGYRVTDQGLSALESRPAAPNASTSITVVDAAIPSHLNPQAVVAYLARRWFRGLRWYGQSGTPRETVLTWLPDSSGGPVRVRIGGGHVRVEVEAGSRDVDYAAARGVLAALAELYGVLPDRETEYVAGAVFTRGFAA